MVALASLGVEQQQAASIAVERDLQSSGFQWRSGNAGLLRAVQGDPEREN